MRLRRETIRLVPMRCVRDAVLCHALYIHLQNGAWSIHLSGAYHLILWVFFSQSISRLCVCEAAFKQDSMLMYRSVGLRIAGQLRYRCKNVYHKILITKLAKKKNVCLLYGHRLHMTFIDKILIIESILNKKKNKQQKTKTMGFVLQICVR